MKPPQGELHLNLLNYPVMGSPKLDGFRCHIENCVPYVGSRRSVLVNRDLRAALGRAALIGCDGEIIVGSPTSKDVWSNTSKLVMTEGESITDKLVKLYLFDLWHYPKMMYKDRYASLCKLYVNLPDDVKQYVEVVENTLLYDEDDVKEYYKNSLFLGYEGVMLRDATALYRYGRCTLKSGELIRLKPFTDVEVKIIGMCELTNMFGKYMGTMGSLQCLHGNDRVDVGTGFTEKLRNVFWDNRDKIIGQYVTIKHTPTIKDLPRNPVYLRPWVESPNWFKELLLK